MGTQQQTFGDWSALSGPYMELQQMSQAAGEKVVRAYTSFYSDNIADAVRAGQTMQRITDPSDFVVMQMKLLTEHGEKTLEFLEEMFQIYKEAISEHGRWTQDKFSTAVKSGKVATMPVGVKKQQQAD